MNEPSTEPQLRNLKKDCLSYPEVIAQSVSVIAPATVPAAVVGLVYASAGNGMWLSFLLGLIGLTIVALNVNQFARRSASPGSLYTYIVKGLGPTAGVLAGWALLLGYIATGMSTLCGFAIFAQIIIGSIGIHLPVLALFVVCAAAACYIAYRDIQFSAKLMLVFEILAMLVILLLGVLLWKHTGFAIDTDQLTLKGTTPSGILLGVVLVVFAFSGFESATSLGDEAKNPLQTIPRAVRNSTIIAGVYFLFMAYVVTLAFQGTGANLGQEEAPLNFLAPRVGLGFFGTLINFGALLSFFACTLACINSTARIVFAMSRHGLFHDFLGEAHHVNKTPHIAVVLTALITLLVPGGVFLFGVSAFEAQGHFGTLASFGFLLIYLLVSLAAPVYLRRLKVLRVRDVAYSVLAIAFIALPVLGTIGIPGSTLFPPPSFPDNMFIWIFIAYMSVGISWLIVQRYRSPKMIHTVRSSVDEIHESYEATGRLP